MSLWYVNPSRKRKFRKNPYGKCPKCRVILTPEGRTCAFCKGKALKRNPKMIYRGRMVSSRQRRLEKKRNIRKFYSLMQKNPARRKRMPRKRRMTKAFRRHLKRLHARMRRNPWVGRGKNRKWKKSEYRFKHIAKRALREHARKLGKKGKKVSR